MATLLRSLLFVPGSQPARFRKADASNADLICIDLEDAVLPVDKDAARQATVDYIQTVNRNVCVRINPIDSDLGQADAMALAKANPAFIMLAKCSSAENIDKVSEYFEQSTQFIGLIETIIGLENADAIAATDRVSALMFGGADLSAELGCEFSYQPLLLVRSRLVMAAAKAKIDLIDVPFVDFKNTQDLLSETQKIKALGFTGKAAVHPCQIEPIHQGFMPTDAQISYAQSVVAAVEGPDAGVVVVNGKMVDRPIILASYRVLALANLATKHQQGD
ncbi:HpcH/HpaI aldolase/citrate lyase family protein [Thalassotalea atypica]|uniref:HpcH/HpaI aldolase/citrate lyase family protein n=1 Tax=Thalassotalea atypica TaxID=2054316 RepID=UPI002573460B|nr:CoA ester lyase [Thalassotalea atypica]